MANLLNSADDITSKRIREKKEEETKSDRSLVKIAKLECLHCIGLR